MVDDDAAVDPLREDLEEGRRRRPHQELGHRAAVFVASLANLKETGSDTDSTDTINIL